MSCARHQLSDDDANEYSTNLDRNRYGADDQYLFTVIKFNLEALGLCPLICQVEIIDTKAARRMRRVVKVPEERCTSHGEPVAPPGDRRADRVVIGGSATHPHRPPRRRGGGGARRLGRGRGRPRKACAPESTGTDRAQWRVPTAPLSRSSEVASAPATPAAWASSRTMELTQVGEVACARPRLCTRRRAARRAQAELPQLGGHGGGVAVHAPRGGGDVGAVEEAAAR